MVENPYDRLRALSSHSFADGGMGNGFTGAANFNYGSRSQSSSLDASPVEPELVHILNKNNSLEMASVESGVSGSGCVR